MDQIPTYTILISNRVTADSCSMQAGSNFRVTYTHPNYVISRSNIPISNLCLFILAF